MLTEAPLSLRWECVDVSSHASVDHAGLSRVEKDRLGTLPPGRAEVFARRRNAVRMILSELTGGRPADLEIRQRCRDCGGPHGRPSVRGGAFTGLHASWSYSGHLVAVGIADSPIAIDVERLGVRPGAQLDRVAGLVDAPAARREECDVLSRWTQLECLVKLGLTSLDRALREPISQRPRSLAHSSTRRTATYVVTTATLGGHDAGLGVSSRR